MLFNKLTNEELEAILQCRIENGLTATELYRKGIRTGAVDGFVIGVAIGIIIALTLVLITR